MKKLIIFLLWPLIFFPASLWAGGPIIMNPGGQALSPTDSPTFAGISVGTSPVTFNDSTLVNDGTNILAQKNGTAAQIFRVYNTDPGANDEFLEINWQTVANNVLIRTGTAASGTARPLIFTYGGTTSTAANIPISALSPVTFANVNIGTAISTGRVAIATNGSITATSGTHYEFVALGDVAPTATSTLAFRPIAANFTVNYSNGTPGAGSWEAFSARVTETANPTGTNYFFHFLGGAAGATEVAALTSAGELSFAGISGDTDAKALCKKADDNIGTCSSLVGADGTCTCG